ncbi:MAG: DUF4340 domain-containing protein [Cyclobacteriaceae bacterium]|nr:DUF4340 domain-containing protein [Cyclobacteriaceae bacterium]
MSGAENRNRNLLISLVVLSVVTFAWYWYAQRDRSVVNKALFRVDRLDEVDQVVLERESDQVVLKFDGARWLVNNEVADRNLIDVLFATLQQAQPIRPLAQSQQDSVKQKLQAEAVQVHVMTGEEVLKSFVAGGNARKTQAYFFLPDEDVYLVAIPGYRVYVSGIFELDINGWKDKHVFQINWRNFQSLTASFPRSPTDDFKVSFKDGFFNVEELPATDTTRLNDYLDAVSFLTVDSYVANDAFRDSLRSAQPALTISLRDVANRSFVLSLYPDPRDPSKIAGIIDSAQLAWFDRRLLEGILKTRSHLAPQK